MAEEWTMEVFVMVVELSDGNFKSEVLDSKEPVIVDFWADWCMPCKMMGPVFEGVSKDYKGRVKFAKLDTMEYPQYPQKYSVDGIPCLIVFNGGKEKGRVVGMMPADVLKRQIDNIIG